jgi:hypothetical protein
MKCPHCNHEIERKRKVGTVTYVDFKGRTVTKPATTKWPPEIGERYIGKWPPAFRNRG